MEQILLGAQVAAIFTYVGGALFLYRTYVKVFEERLAGAREENERLKQQIVDLNKQIVTPTDAQAYINMVKESVKIKLEAMEQEKRRLQKDLEEAKRSGDHAAREKETALEKLKEAEGKAAVFQNQLNRLDTSYEAIIKQSDELEREVEGSPFLKDIIPVEPFFPKTRTKFSPFFGGGKGLFGSVPKE